MLVGLAVELDRFCGLRLLLKADLSAEKCAAVILALRK
jgi:hypothetical protein